MGERPEGSLEEEFGQGDRAHLVQAATVQQSHQLVEVAFCHIERLLQGQQRLLHGSGVLPHTLLKLRGPGLRPSRQAPPAAPPPSRVEVPHLRGGWGGGRRRTCAAGNWGTASRSRPCSCEWMLARARWDSVSLCGRQSTAGWSAPPPGACVRPQNLQSGPQPALLRPAPLPAPLTC